MKRSNWRGYLSILILILIVGVASVLDFDVWPISGQPEKPETAPVEAPEAPVALEPGPTPIQPLIVAPTAVSERLTMARRRAVTVPTMPVIRRRPVDPPQVRPIINGYAAPVMFDPMKMRMNILLNAHPYAPWSEPYNAVAVAAFRQTIGVEGNTFPVQIWRDRNGMWKRIATVHVPASKDGYLIFTVPDVKKGDLVVIKYTPGLLVSRSAQHPQAYELPLISVIDNATHAPTTLPSLEFPPTEMRYIEKDT